MSLPVLNCTDCGVCCFHMGYPAFNFPVEEQLGQIEWANDGVNEDSAEGRDRVRWTEMPTELRDKLVKFIASYSTETNANSDGLDGPCIWLDPDTKLCRHHEYRPQVCRDFEVGSRGCLDWRKAYQIDSL